MVKMPLKVFALRKIGWWLSGLYAFWVGFLVALALNQRAELTGALIAFFVGTGLAAAALLFLAIRSILARSIGKPKALRLLAIAVLPFMLWFKISDWFALRD